MPTINKIKKSNFLDRVKIRMGVGSSDPRLTSKFHTF